MPLPTILSHPTMNHTTNHPHYNIQNPITTTTAMMEMMNSVQHMEGNISNSSPSSPSPSLLRNSTTTMKNSNIIELNEYDVICGRNKFARSYKGNKVFRQIIEGYGPIYQKAVTRNEKSSVTNKVIHVVHANGGRFLMVKNEGSSMNSKKQSNKPNFEIASHSYVYEKVSHALRSTKGTTNTNNKRGMITSTTTTGGTTSLNSMVMMMSSFGSNNHSATNTTNCTTSSSLPVVQTMVADNNNSFFPTKELYSSTTLGAGNNNNNNIMMHHQNNDYYSSVPVVGRDQSILPSSDMGLYNGPHGNFGVLDNTTSTNNFNATTTHHHHHHHPNFLLHENNYLVDMILKQQQQQQQQLPRLVSPPETPTMTDVNQQKQTLGSTEINNAISNTYFPQPDADDDNNEMEPITSWNTTNNDYHQNFNNTNLSSLLGDILNEIDPIDFDDNNNNYHNNISKSSVGNIMNDDIEINDRINETSKLFQNNHKNDNQNIMSSSSIFVNGIDDDNNNDDTNSVLSLDDDEKGNSTSSVGSSLLDENLADFLTTMI